MPDGLQGKRVLVTRAAGQNTKLSRQLADLGAIPVEFPTIQIVPPADLTPLDDAIASLSQYDWLIFTSANGVTHFWLRLIAAGKSAADVQSLKIAVVGPATAAALEKFNVRVNHIPPQHVAESLLETLPVSAGERVLYPTADIARPVLADGLRAKGVIVDRVTTYQTQPVTISGNLPELLPTLDVLTFTSSSTVRNFVALLNIAVPANAIGGAVVACIGPIAAQTARELGLPVHIVPSVYTIAGLVSAMEDYFWKLGIGDSSPLNPPSKRGEIPSPRWGEG